MKTLLSALFGIVLTIYLARPAPMTCEYEVWRVNRTTLVKHMTCTRH